MRRNIFKNKKQRLSSYAIHSLSLSLSFLMDSSSTTRYDVFVSFTGEDIGRTFVSHLYRSLEQKGICAFKDETKKPFEIRLAAIRASKIAIVVVSKNYVSSTSVWWILKELQEILNYHRSGYVTVFPVYYGVDPCDVKSQAEEFAADQTQKPDKVGTWKALMELCCFSGQHSDKWYLYRPSASCS